MNAQAIWNNTVIAETDLKNIIKIDGNFYFPDNSINKQYFTPSETHTTCSWKGLASYFNIVVDGKTNLDAAWYYKEPKDGSVEKVSELNDGGNGNYANYVAFWKGVEVK